MFKIDLIKEKKEIEFFLKQRNNLLQSWEWGEFQKSLGRKVWWFKVHGLNTQENGRVNGETGKLLATALVIKYNLPFGKNYLYCPRGPLLNFWFPCLDQGFDGQAIFNFQKRKKKIIGDGFKKFKIILELIIKKIREIAEQENVIFFRMDPEWPEEEKYKSLLADFRFIKSAREVQPKTTLVLDLTKSEDEILAQMHPKTRYNIRLARRKGVKVKISNAFLISDEDFEEFWKLMEKTAIRDGFKSHPKEYYKAQIKILGKKGLVKLFLAEIETQSSESELQNQVIAAIIVSFYGGKATYLHGASDYRFRNLMASHLLQWEAMCEAKREKCKWYDFWGIQTKCQTLNTKCQTWAGITRFKKGFARNGNEVNYIGAYDLPIQKGWYRLYNLFRTMKPF